MTSLFNQLSDTEREGLAIMLGFKESAGFRTALRDIPAFEEEEFWMGRAAIAFLENRLAYFKRLDNERMGQQLSDYLETL
jgi:hypothetical protein